MKRKYLKLKSNEELVVCNENGGILIQSKDKELIISEVEKRELENIYIKILSDTEITSFVLTSLLENNHINLNADKSKLTNQKLINGLLENHYDLLQGKINKDVKDMYFECITEYKVNNNWLFKKILNDIIIKIKIEMVVNLWNQKTYLMSNVLCDATNKINN